LSIHIKVKYSNGHTIDDKLQRKTSVVCPLEYFTMIWSDNCQIDETISTVQKDNNNNNNDNDNNNNNNNDIFLLHNSNNNNTLKDNQL
jgi:hypothetical protein